jgi:hypothetical protein
MKDSEFQVLRRIYGMKICNASNMAWDLECVNIYNRYLYLDSKWNKLENIL